MNKLKVIVSLIIFIFVSFKFSSQARDTVSSMSSSVISAYLGSIEHLSKLSADHLFQKNSIREYRKEIEILTRQAELTVAYASMLNSYLKEHNKAAYEPSLELVQAISYANISDYNRVWLDFDGFECEKSYGLMYEGFAAGVVICKDSKPLGLLNGDDKSIYSVLVGSSEIPGVAVGDDRYVVVKYIPMWMEPQVGDEVVTSGKDNLFFKGVPVGKVVEVIKVDSYQSVIVEPYVSTKVPTYMYAIN